MLATEARGIIERWQAALDALQHAIQRLKKVNAKYPDVMLEEIAERRHKALAVIGDKERRLKQIAQIALDQEKYWADAAFLLSRQRFDDDIAKDSLIRACWLAELTVMPASTFNLIVQNALEESAQALLWQCVLANRQRSEKADELDLAVLMIPQRAEALDAIAQIGGLAELGTELCAQLRDTSLP